MANLLSALEPLFDRNSQVDAEFVGNGFRLSHDRRGQFTRFGTLNDFDQRRMRERADRIVSDVAHQLYPHVVTDVCANRTTESGFDKRVGYAPAAFAFRSIRFADREACSLDV